MESAVHERQLVHPDESVANAKSRSLFGRARPWATLDRQYTQFFLRMLAESIFQSINESEAGVRGESVSRFSESVHEWF